MNRRAARLHVRKLGEFCERSLRVAHAADQRGDFAEAACFFAYAESFARHALLTAQAGVPA